MSDIDPIINHPPTEETIPAQTDEQTDQIDYSSNNTPNDANETPQEEHPENLPHITAVLAVPSPTDSIPALAAHRCTALTREQSYINDFTADFNAVSTWHRGYLTFLQSRHAPILAQLKEVYTTLCDGQAALRECLHLLDLIILKYTQDRDMALKVSLYHQPLASTPNNYPTITSSGREDGSILSLAAVASCLYDSSIDYNKLITSLTKSKTTISAYRKQYQFKPLFALIKNAEECQDLCQKRLGAWHSAIDEYRERYSDLGFIFHPTEPKNKSTIINIFELRRAYTESAHRLWQTHTELCTTVYKQTNEYLIEDQKRQQFMHDTLCTVTTELTGLHTDLLKRLQQTALQQQQAPDQAKKYIEYSHYLQKQQIERKRIEKEKAYSSYDNTHADNPPTANTAPTMTTQGKATSFYLTNPDTIDSQNDTTIIRVNSTLPRPIAPILTSSATAKYFNNIPSDATVQELETAALQVTPPGAFPTDKTIIQSTLDVFRPSFFSNKPMELIYTKSHQIHLLPLGKNKPNTEQDMANSGSFLLYNDADWIMNGAVTIATQYHKNDKTMVLKEHNPSFFSRNPEHKVLFKTAADCKAWIDFINAHNKFYIESVPAGFVPPPPAPDDAPQ